MTNLSEHTDRQLYELLAAGDEFSFRQLYNRLSPGIYKVAFRYLRSAELAEDVVQDTFLALWSNKNRVPEIESLDNYVFITARNQCLRILKNKASLTLIHDEVLREISDSPVENDDEQYAQIVKAIEQLPPQQKKIFEMAKLRGLSHESISQELNISPSTVNNHITTAFRSVRNYIRRSTSEIMMFIVAVFS